MGTEDGFPGLHNKCYKIQVAHGGDRFSIDKRGDASFNFQSETFSHPKDTWLGVDVLTEQDGTITTRLRDGPDGTVLSELQTVDENPLTGRGIGFYAGGVGRAWIDSIYSTRNRA